MCCITNFLEKRFNNCPNNEHNQLSSSESLKNKQQTGKKYFIKQLMAIPNQALSKREKARGN